MTELQQTRSLLTQLDETIEKLKGIKKDFGGSAYDLLWTPENRDPWCVDYEPLYPWSFKSKQAMETLDPKLVFLCNKLADIFDLSVLWGYRDEDQQTDIHDRGLGLPWPTSNHNVSPSRAVDIVPFPVNWDKVDRFDEMIGAAYAIAKEGGFRIRSGKYFSNVDYSHLELID